MSENITVSLATNGDGQALRLDSNQTITLVKVEPSNGPGGETITEIQNYLETFNKEIEGGDPNQTGDGQEALSRDGNTYYVDESGQYYYTQAPVVAVMSSGDAEGATGTMQTGDGQSFVVQQPGSIVQQGTAQNSGNAQRVTLSNEAGNPMLINAGEGTFGTLMPQDSSTGELSYVLIVQPSAGNEKTEIVEEQNRQLLVTSTVEEEQDQDLTVYDFDEGEEGGEMEQMVREVLVR